MTYADADKVIENLMCQTVGGIVVCIHIRKTFLRDTATWVAKNGKIFSQNLKYATQQ